MGTYGIIQTTYLGVVEEVNKVIERRARVERLSGDRFIVDMMLQWKRQ